MLDVHAPEHGIGGVRDFMMHLLTITAGLLIAIALEQSVEWMHHRHQRHEAEEKIREEISKNEKALEEGAPILMEEFKTISEVAAALRESLNGKGPGDKHWNMEYQETEIPDAAWRTANSTGVLEYLPYDEVEKFGDAYREQALLQSMEQKAFDDYLELGPYMRPDPDEKHMILPMDAQHKISREDAEHLLPITLRAFGHLAGVWGAGKGTSGSYYVALH